MGRAEDGNTLRKSQRATPPPCNHAYMQQAEQTMRIQRGRRTRTSGASVLLDRRARSATHVAVMSRTPSDTTQHSSASIETGCSGSLPDSVSPPASANAM